MEGRQVIFTRKIESEQVVAQEIVAQAFRSPSLQFWIREKGAAEREDGQAKIFKSVHGKQSSSMPTKGKTRIELVVFLALFD